MKPYLEPLSELRTPNGIRTRATAVKGRRPRPLDDGGFKPGHLWRETAGDRTTIGAAPARLQTGIGRSPRSGQQAQRSRPQTEADAGHDVEQSRLAGTVLGQPHGLPTERRERRVA